MDNFPDNLRALCGYRASISEVGRDLGIDRSQLNRYLTGASRPRPALLRRICEYFGVETHDVALPTAEFMRILRDKDTGEGETTRLLRRHFERLMAQSEPRLFNLAGSFFEYCHALSTPNRIMRSLIVFTREHDHLVFRRLTREGAPHRPCRRHFRYQGVATMTGDRIFMNDYEYGAAIEITQTILYPDYAPRWSALYGLKLGVSANRAHAPCAVRTYLERTAPRTSRLEALRSCGLLAFDDPTIPPHVPPLISNENAGPFVFAAHEGVVGAPGDQGTSPGQPRDTATPQS